MPTKIINVLQDDNFENILRIFQETPANEVIFVLPRKHEALSSDDHFYVLAEAANEQGKSVMILASNPDINELALKYNLGVLTSAKAGSQAPSQRVKKDSKVKKIIVKEPEIVEPEEEVEAENNSPEEESDSYIPQGRGMTDIIRPPLEKDKKINVKIYKKSERPFEIEIKNNEDIKEDVEEKDNIRGAIDEIESVWQRRPDNGEFNINRRVPALFPKKSMLKFKLLPSLNLSNKALYLMGISVVTVLAIVIFISSGSANIIIKPRPHVLNLDLSIKTSDQFMSVDVDNKAVPGQLFSIEKRIEQTFPATGERDVVQKARGKVTIYNEYGTAPQVLIATTRFESSGGLIFRSLKTVTVPGTRVVNGEIIPGSIDVEVIADKAGEFYNIDAGRFTIPAFKEKGDNDRYQKYYAISAEPMRGGIVGKAKVVTDQDYLKAKEEVHNKAVSEAEADLKSQSAELKILNATPPSVQDVQSTAQVDEAVDEFTVSEIVKLESVGFRESDLHSLISQYVGKVNELDVFPDKTTLEFSSVAFNQESKILSFNISVKGSAYSRINKDRIIKDLIGRNEESIKEYIKGLESDVLGARVVLSPFWVKKVPTNIDRIKFELQYE